MTSPRARRIPAAPPAPVASTDPPAPSPASPTTAVASPPPARPDAILDALPDPLLVATPLRGGGTTPDDFLVVYANRAARAIFGTDRGLVGERVRERWPGADRAGLFVRATETVDGQLPLEADDITVWDPTLAVERRFDLRATWVEGELVMAFHDSTGAHRAVVTRETELVRRAERLARRSAYLEETEQLLRNRLSVVEGWAELLAAESPVIGEAERKTGLRAIARSAGALLDDLRILLAEAAAARHATSAALVPVDIAAVAAFVADSYADRPDVPLLHVLPRSGVLGLATVGALEGAIRALVENAIGAAGADGSVELVSRRGRDGRAVLVIRDDGPGLPSGYDPFPAAAPREDGRGVELQVALTFVEGIGGELTARTLPAGGGAEFTIRLPAPPAEATPTIAEPGGRRPRRARTGGRPAARRPATERTA